VVARTVEPTQEYAASRYHPIGESDWLSAPHDVVRMTHLPGCPEKALFESYASWYEALLTWMPRALTPTRLRIAEIRPGVWVGSRARVSPMAELISPCWIGDQVTVEAGAVVGPGAIIEDRAVVGEKARVAHSWVGPDTFVGALTSVTNSLAWGSTLIDWRTDSALHVPDPFLLSSLVGSSVAPTTDRYGRALPKKYSPAPAGLIPALRSPMGGPANLQQSG
jgi:carbonic anhydrase/acetyltransferase-like protein (isoleucine patch superfamily)